MIVSIATVVLPVCLSQIISSLCPRPIGTKPSTDLRPVCIGSVTDFLGIIPGALISTLFLFVVLTGPRPSIGFLNKFYHTQEHQKLYLTFLLQLVHPR